MNARDSLLIALPAVLIGLGIGSQLDLFLGSAPDAIAASGPGPRTGLGQAGDAGGAAPPPLVPVRADAERATAPSTPAPAAAGVSASELERALESVRAPAVAADAGAGTIHGTVLDEDGAPLAGVTVIGSRRPIGSRASDPADAGGGPPADRSLKEYLQAHADEWAEGRAQRRRVTTGVDGVYALDGLDESSNYSLAAYREGYVVEAEQNAYDVLAGQEVSFRARAVHEVPLEVLTADGQPVADTVIVVERGNTSKQYAWDGEQKVLRLVDGRVGLTAYGGVRPTGAYGNEVDSSHRSEKVSLDVLDNGGATVQLVLAERGGVRGLVLDPWNTASTHQVKALRLAPDGDLNETALAQSTQEARVRGGRYSLLDLTPGRYAIGLTTRRNEALVMHAIVDLAGGIVELDLHVPDPDANENLVVRALGPSGRALEGVTFNLHQQRAGSSSSGGVESRRAPDGAYWISLGNRYAGFFDAWPEKTAYTLTVQHPEFGNREFELEEGQRELEVRFVEPVSIIVVVSGLVGSGQEGKVRASVERVKDDEDERPDNRYFSRTRGHNDGTLSPEGKARFDGLEPGLWRVGLMPGRDVYGQAMVVSRDVRVLTGELTVDLAMPALHSLTIHAPGLAVDAWLSLRPAEEKDNDWWSSGRNGNLDKDHRIVFDGLTAGQYILAGNGINEETEVTVPGGEFFLDVKEPNCMRVTIGDMEGELYKAGLRAGDLIIGVDGKDLASANDVWTLWREAKGEAISLSVLRGNERLDYSMPVIKMSGNWFEKLGGMLSPTTRE